MRATATMTPPWKLMRDSDAGLAEILFHFRVTKAPVDVRDIAVRMGGGVLDSAPGTEGLVRSTETSAPIEVNPNASRSLASASPLPMNSGI